MSFFKRSWPCKVPLFKMENYETFVSLGSNFLYMHPVVSIFETSVSLNFILAVNSTYTLLNSIHYDCMR